MHLRPIKKVLICNDVVPILSRVFLESGLLNVIVLNKPQIVIRYSRMELTIHDKIYVVDAKTSREELSKLSPLMGELSNIVIHTIKNEVLQFSSSELKGLRGVTIMATDSLAIEYIKSIIFDALYGNSELYTLCTRNPKIIDGGVNIFNELDIHPSQCLSEYDISDISIYLKNHQQVDIGGLMSKIYTLKSTYKLNPTKVEFTRRSVVVSIYEDVRAIRYSEMFDNSYELVDREVVDNETISCY